MATTTDCTSLAQFAGTNAPYGRGSFGVVKLHVDMSSITAEKGVTVSGADADVLQVWDIPVGCMILGALLDVTTACTDSGTATVAVGTNAGVNTFVAATSIKTVAKTGMTTSATYGAAQMVYAATDTLDLLFGGTEADIDSGVFDVYLYCLFNEEAA